MNAGWEDRHVMGTDGPPQIDLFAGEMVEVRRQNAAEGWFRGRVVGRDVTGTFPSGFIELLPNEPFPLAAAAAPAAAPAATIAPAAAAAVAAPATIPSDWDTAWPALPVAAPAKASAAAAANVASSSSSERRNVRQKYTQESAMNLFNMTRGSAAGAGAGAGAVQQQQQQAESKEDASMALVVPEGSTVQDETPEQIQAAAAAEARRALIDTMCASQVGHLFGSRSNMSDDSSSSSSSSSSVRPALPLESICHVLDYLLVGEVVGAVAASSRSAYATCVEYSAFVQATTVLAASDAPPSSSLSSSSASSCSTVPRCAPSSFPAEKKSANRYEFWSRDGGSLSPSMVVDARVQSRGTLDALLGSRLRGVVTSIFVGFEVLLEQGHLAQLAQHMTQLQRLDIALLRSEVTPASMDDDEEEEEDDENAAAASAAIDPFVIFPSHLRRLRVRFSCGSGWGRKGAWSSDQCDSFVHGIVTAASRVGQSLTYLDLSLVPESPATPAGEWLRPLRDLPNLQYLAFDLGGIKPFAALRALPALTEIVLPNENPWRDDMPKLLAMPHALKLRQLPLRTTEVTTKLRPFLESLSGSLVALCPRHWDLGDISWLSGFPLLRKLKLAEYTYTSGVNPSLGSITALLANTPLLTDLCVEYPTLNANHLNSILEALPNLRVFEIASKALDSFQPFAAHASVSSSEGPQQKEQCHGLARTLEVLRVSTPNVPRDHLELLLVLRELRALNICGSFMDPLYSRQLAPFQPPYPRAPLHWLREFVPRSEKEPVPTPPIDLQAVAAAHQAFNARVAAGQVCAAELLNSGQLSLAMQFLTGTEFMQAARACQMWRHAALLPTAWGLPSPRVDVPHAESSSTSSSSSSSSSAIVGLDDGPTCANDEDALPSLTSPLPSSCVGMAPHDGRVLSLKSSAPECSRSILSCLPLWRHARALHLEIAHQADSHVYWSDSLVKAYNDAIEAPLLGVASLQRLESLDVNWSGFKVPEAIVRLMGQIGPKGLRRSSQTDLPKAAWQHLTRMECMDYTWREAGFAPSSYGLLQMHALHTLVLEGFNWPEEVGPALCALSAQHALRKLHLTLSSAPTTPTPLQVFNAPAANIKSDALDMLAASLNGYSRNSVFASAAAAAAALSSPSHPPALLEALCVVVQGPRMVSSSSPEGKLTAAIPLASFLLLPRLRRLHLAVRIQQEVPLDFHTIQGSAATPSYPLQSLYLDGVRIVEGSLARLGLLRKLREVRLLRRSDGSDHEAGEHKPAQGLPEGCLANWVDHMSQLQMLEIDGFQIPTGELSCLSKLEHLRSLHLCGQREIQLADLDVLPRIRKLDVLSLEDLRRVGLLERCWMGPGVGRVLTPEQLQALRKVFRRVSKEDRNMGGRRRHWIEQKQESAGEEQRGEEGEEEGREEEQKEAAAPAAPEEEYDSINWLEAPVATAIPAASASTAAAASSASATVSLAASSSSSSSSSSSRARPSFSFRRRPSSGEKKRKNRLEEEEEEEEEHVKEAKSGASASASSSSAADVTMAPDAEEEAKSAAAEAAEQMMAAHSEADEPEPEAESEEEAEEEEEDPESLRPSDYADLLGVLAACGSLRRLHWRPSFQSLDAATLYSYAHSWQLPLSRPDGPYTAHQLRVAMAKEMARERHALRTIMQQRVERIEAARTQATQEANAAAASSSSSSIDTPSSSSSSSLPPLLQINVQFDPQPRVTLRSVAAADAAAALLTPDEDASDAPADLDGLPIVLPAGALLRTLSFRLRQQQRRRRANSHEERQHQHEDDPRGDEEMMQQEQANETKARQEEEAKATQQQQQQPDGATSAASGETNATIPMEDEP